MGKGVAKPPRESAFAQASPSELVHRRFLKPHLIFLKQLSLDRYEREPQAFQSKRSSQQFPSKLLRRIIQTMLKPRRPQAPDRLPSLEHAGISIEALQHHGFSIPAKGPMPAARMLYGARNPADGERHWRGSYEEMVALIDKGFDTGDN